MSTLTGNVFVLDSGVELKNVHPLEKCGGQTCPIHKPSPHFLRLWKTDHAKITPDSTHMIVRQCPLHMEYHPDPDSWAFAYATHNKGGWLDKLRAHMKKCCGCCAPKFSGDKIPPLTAYSMAYTFWTKGVSKYPLPTAQEFPLLPGIATPLRLIAATFFNSDFMPTRQVENFPMVLQSQLFKNYLHDGDEFFMVNPIDIRQKKVEQKVCFVHYRSGFTASWPVAVDDGHATMSQNIDSDTFDAKVFSPIMSGGKS